MLLPELAGQPASPLLHKSLIHLASSTPDLAITGQYFQDTNVAEPSKNAQNDTHARQLWDYSLELLQKIDTAVPEKL